MGSAKKIRKLIRVCHYGERNFDSGIGKVSGGRTVRQNED